MSSTFRCYHCGKICRKNRRLKGDQKYCGASMCQQSRKNAWERTKCRNNPEYKSKRQASKKSWRETNRRGASYQSRYRKSHPDYREANHQKQLLRNQKRQDLGTAPKIVKTDGLASQSIDTQGVYVLLPWRRRTDAKEIVKTDTLLVQVLDIQRDKSHLAPGLPP